MPKDVFVAEQFTPTKWATSADKARWANWFVRFVREDCSKALFFQGAYDRLTNSFGHIAHYNRRGFFEEFFLNPAAKLRFLRCCLLHEAVGDPAWTWSDVERQLQSWMLTSGLLEGYVHRAKAAQDVAEWELLAHLLAKHPQMRNVA